MLIVKEGLGLRVKDTVRC